MLRIFLSAACILIGAFPVDSQIQLPVHEINPEITDNTWDAQWITHPGASATFCFAGTRSSLEAGKRTINWPS